MRVNFGLAGDPGRLVRYRRHYCLEMASYAARWVEYIASQFRGNGYCVNTRPTKTIIEDVEYPILVLQTESSFNLYIEWLR